MGEQVVAWKALRVEGMALWVTTEECRYGIVIMSGDSKKNHKLLSQKNSDPIAVSI